MGGLDNSFLIKDGSVEVFRNVNDGKSGTGEHVTRGSAKGGRYPQSQADAILTPLQPLKSSS
eukprot:283055-Pyramimonas_sp.AAC.1